ncbi:Aldo/keto reductase [Daedalea quercina L-15889]|uniref:Aldo/keto reductase n=1 Tax=Daedalea quercina L-15889 TaxID=1314783 RepID=A0A165RM43_9APHY|nr:Aldo/keto reductase [Daedalea quercina L-15889]
MAPSTYPTRKLGANGPAVSAIGFGAMGVGAFYGETNTEEAFRTLTYAADRGVTFWDTADMYGNSEEVLGNWFIKTNRRSEIFLATKFGSRDLELDNYKQNSKPSYIRRRIEVSLKRLKADWIDLYYQHRVDPEVPIEVVMETLAEFVKSGRIRYIGLSECTIDVLKRAKAVPIAGEKLVACQMEFSPFELEIEKSGFVAVARKLGVAIVAYSPLGRGMITGRFKSRADFEPSDLRLLMPRFTEENFAKNLEVADKFAEIANKYSATPSQITLAWILAEHPDFIPIPGSRSAERLEENAEAAEIVLKDEDVKALREIVEAADVRGGRAPELFAHLMASECIPLSEWKGE